MTRLAQLILLPSLACASGQPRGTADTDAGSAHAGSAHAGREAGSAHDSSESASNEDDLHPDSSCLKLVAAANENTGLTTCADWAPHDSYALSGGVDELRLLHIDLQSGALSTLASYRGQQGRPAAWWSPDGRFALSAASDLQLLKISRSPPSIRDVARDPGQAEDLFHVAWSPSGSHAVASGRYVQLLAVDTDAPSLQTLGRFREHEGRVFMSTWSADGKYVLTGGEDRTARLLAVNTSEGTLREVARFVADGMVTVVEWHPKGKLALIGTWAGAHQLKLLAVDIVHGKLVEQTPVPTDDISVRAIKWSPDGRYAIWAAHNGPPRLGKLADDGTSITPLATLPAYDAGVHELSWSQDGEFFVVGASQSDQVTLVDARDCLTP